MNITPELISYGVIWYLVFLFSTVCHEGAHALAAKLGGDPTAFEQGQVTLNPLPHIRREPFGTVLVPILSYAFYGWMIGWASAPYDPAWQRRHPRRAAWMALAGPGANFFLMLVAALVIREGLALGYFRVPANIRLTQLVVAANPETTGFIASVLSILFGLNLLLGTFNLFPLPPLDGSTGIGLFLPETTAVRLFDFLRESGLALPGLLVAWAIFNKLFPSVLRFALRLLYASG